MSGALAPADSSITPSASSSLPSYSSNLLPETSSHSCGASSIRIERARPAWNRLRPDGRRSQQHSTRCWSNHLLDDQMELESQTARPLDIHLVCGYATSIGLLLRESWHPRHWTKQRTAQPFKSTEPSWADSIRRTIKSQKLVCDTSGNVASMIRKLPAPSIFVPNRLRVQQIQNPRTATKNGNDPRPRFGGFLFAPPIRPGTISAC